MTTIQILVFGFSSFVVGFTLGCWMYQDFKFDLVSFGLVLLSLLGLCVSIIRLFG